MPPKALPLVYQILFRPRCWGCGVSAGSYLDFCGGCRRLLLAKSPDPARYLLPLDGPVKPLLQALRGEASFLGARWCELLLRRRGSYTAWQAAGITMVTISPRAKPRREDGLPLLARKIAASLGAEFRETLVKVNPRSQHGKGKVARMDCAPFVGLKNRTENLNGARVLLIDDVDTTGTTLELGAYCLREAGAAAVLTFSVARQVPTRHVVKGFEGEGQEPEDKRKEVEPLLLHLFV